jgi:hypothetical protein
VEALDDDAIRTLSERYAEVIAELDLEAGEPLLVLPNAEFFPDRFTGDARSLELLVARMQGYAGLEDAVIDVELTGEAKASTGGSCGTGSCGTDARATSPDADQAPRLARSDRGYLMRVPRAELGHSIVLTARVASALGALALLEARDPNGAGTVSSAEAELSAVALGFGVLLLEASYLYQKSCGGPRVERGTWLGCDELAVLFALSTAREDHSVRAALAELGTTQRSLVRDAWSVVSESPGLVAALKEHPRRVARGHFRLREGRSILSRLFGRAPRKKDAHDRVTDALGALERGASVDEVAALLEPERR